MKYTISIEIARPRDEVAQLLADPAHIPKWIRGVVLHEPLSGVHGHVGTRSRIVMEMGQQKFEATETITRREPADLHDIPKGSIVHFEREIVAEGMWNVVRDRLSEAGPDTTLWESENEYRFSGLLMNGRGAMGPLPTVGPTPKPRCAYLQAQELVDLSPPSHRACAVDDRFGLMSAPGRAKTGVIVDVPAGAISR